MSAAAPNPNNVLLLALLGIGAYYLFSRQQAGATTIVRPGAQQQPFTAQQIAQWATNDRGLWNQVYATLGGRPTTAQTRDYLQANAAAADAARNQPVYGAPGGDGPTGDPYNSGGDYYPVNPAPGQEESFWAMPLMGRLG